MTTDGRGVPRVFYVMGPSGAGKDSLLNRARALLPADAWSFPPRYITRPGDSRGEHHIPLSESVFHQWATDGMLAFWWSSHGLFYGLGPEVPMALEQGRQVVVNGSRQVLESARQRFPGLKPVVIDVEPMVLRERLHHRGRESETEIDRRLERAAELRDTRPADAIVIDNNGALEQSALTLSERLREIAAPCVPAESGNQKINPWVC